VIRLAKPQQRSHPVSLPPDWRERNQANWDERVAIHVNAHGAYDLDAFRAGDTWLDPIAGAILGPVEGLRVLHLQCHFGMDTLTLARLGATVTGLDFSAPAIETARALATETGLSARARFVEANVYDALAAIPEHGGFDRVFVSWGALCWLPDLVAWARIVAAFLAPGGFLALAEAHPAAYVFDDSGATGDGMPGWSAPYLSRTPLLESKSEDYADPTVPLRNSRTVEFLHPLSDILSALIGSGLRIDAFHEHDSIVWKMFGRLVKRGRNEYAWPDRPWLPLSYSLRAAKPGANNPPPK
jgi:SAM-dependent methyltransferase